jgi:hypothetical protein
MHHNAGIDGQRVGSLRGGRTAWRAAATRRREAVGAARNQVIGRHAGSSRGFTIDARVLASSRENLSAAISQIGDADVALESSHLIRARILAQSAVGALRIVNHRRELVLGLLSE